jgi:LacI family transcriptional regulator
VGIFVGGGGISGVLRAMRETPVERQKCIRIVCRDLGPETHKGLSEKLVTAALCHPLPRISSDLIDVMITSIRHSMSGTVLQRVVPFDIITPENLVA